MSKPVLHTSRLVTLYRRYLDRSDTAEFISETSDFYAIETLVSLLQRGDFETRRAASLALSMIGDVSAIAGLGRRLCDQDRGVRLIADDAFRAILCRDAAPAHQQQLLQVMHLNDGAEFAAALTPGMVLSQRAPQFAEAHHQLGVAWLGVDDFSSAECCLRRCLWLCRFHYPAWIGLAECRRALSDDRGALRFLRIALAICPDLESARASARTIQRSLDRDNPPGAS